MPCFIGVGATKGRRANIKGSKAKGVYLAMEFLPISKKSYLMKSMIRALM